MSAKGQQIVCRKCNETISTDGGHCPRCGTSIRNNAAYLVGVLLGVVLVGAAVFAPGSLLIYGVLGAVVALSSGYLLYEKRQRIEQASGQA